MKATMITAPAMTALALLAACSSAPRYQAQEQPARTLGVTRGPELVFAQAPADILPLLAGATATGENGRVGGELVFWSYRLTDGRDVLLIACAQLDGVDCAARTALVCPAGAPTSLQSASVSGEVRELDCRAIAQAAPGDLRPGCADTEATHPVLASIASCP